MAEGLRVVVDRPNCAGHALCGTYAPEVFELDEDDVSNVLLDPVPAHLADKVRRSAAACPERAITVIEGDA